MRRSPRCEVVPAKRHRVDPQLAGDGIVVGLIAPGGLCSAETTKGAGRDFVGVVGATDDPEMGHSVRPPRQRGAPSRHVHGVPLGIGAFIEDEINVLGHQGAVGLDTGLDMVHDGMTAVGAEAFLGARPQGDGTPRTDGEEDRDQVLGLELLGAEPTAHVGKPYAHFVAIKAEHRRDVIAGAEGVLNRCGEFQGIRAHFGDTAPKILHRVVEDTLKHVGVFEDMIGLAPTLLDITPPEVGPAHQIAGALVVNHRRARFERLANVEE